MSTMRFGIFHEHQLPRPWTGESELTLFQNALEQCELTDKLGIDQVIFMQHAGRNKHERIMESLELFGKEILPEFKDRDESSRAQKFAELEPAMEAAMAGRVDDAPPLPEGYAMTPLARDFVEQVGGGERILEDVARRTAVGEGLQSIEGELAERLEEATQRAAG